MTESNYFDLEMGKLYLLSGVPGAGKSSWLARAGIPDHMVVSTDKLREMLLGYRLAGDLRYRFAKADGRVFEMAETIVETRMAEGLTTFVDATLTTEADRNEFARHAIRHGRAVEVLIFDRPVEVCKARNAVRDARVPESSIDRFNEKFVRESELPYRIVPEDSVARLLRRDLPTSKLDVVGDVHGLLDDLLKLLTKMGYTFSEGVPVHPEGRKLLFLGDIVDRGQQSIEVLQLVRRAVGAGHYMVIGNHEHKLIKFWNSLQAGAPKASSLSSAETAMAFIRLRADEQKRLIEFLKSLPGFYTVDANGRKLAFVHATFQHFNPDQVLHSECMYGQEDLKARGLDVDGMYAAAYEAGHNAYWLVRGHIPQTSVQDCVFSLEREQAFAGELVALRLDEFLAKCDTLQPRVAFEQSVVTQKCTFNFNAHSERFALKRGLDALMKDKLVGAQHDVAIGASIYKYSKMVFFDALWDKSPLLLKARGLVLDAAGNILVHPFDKVFNYGENGAGLALADDHQVIGVEKLNGFLGCISKHPFKNDLLVTTTGSFDSPFVDYIRSFITPALRGRLLRFLSKSNVTLMFEVLHPDDPHIIEYDAKQYGLWLIGARLRVDGSPLMTEEVLDSIAAELDLRRPVWEYTTFGELKAQMAQSKLEGYMVRDAVTQETILKFKTPYYLVTKFLGRLSDSRVRMMYAYPKGFKQQVDEEFYPLVDHLVANVPEAVFFSMSDDARVPMIREIINNMF